MSDKDTIYRQDFDKQLESAEKEALKNNRFVFASALNTIRGNLRSFPSADVQPVVRWIPCSERLPEEAFGCLVTVWDSTPTGEGDDFENILPYFVGWDGEQWNDGDGMQCPFEVIAWMPLPEPYTGDEK